ncbi:MAG: GHKL domain-containing protein [Lachnospiraceae bacterium]|nr:GHKL domain-containing protein [Lachnospiraceae bacterium]
MPSFLYYFIGFMDSVTGHLMFVSYLLAVTDEQAIWNRLKKLPPLLLSPLIAILLSLGLSTVTKLGILQYFITTIAILAMCSLWVMRTWRWDFRRAFCAVCMAGILQVATTAISQIFFLMFPSGLQLDMAAMAAALFLSIAAAALLKRFHFGAWFRLLLEDQSNLHRTAALIFALEMSMEIFLVLQNGVQGQYLAAYYSLVVVLVLLIVGLVVYLAHRFDDSRTLQAQRDIIAQQQLYEQSLEDIRKEIRSFRHDYKNLLAGLALHMKEGTQDALCSTLEELDADFDRHLGEKIQLSNQIGNLCVPQIRSLLLAKITDMRKKGVECRLEVLYPVETVNINVWDFVRCLGILTDNAAEAALDTPQPWVGIILLALDGRLSVRISNPYANNIDPKKIWENGWSTKGPGRGLGLAGYQRILESYPNVCVSTSWENSVFVQELTLEGRL